VLYNRQETIWTVQNNPKYKEKRQGMTSCRLLEPFFNTVRDALAMIHDLHGTVVYVYRMRTKHLEHVFFMTAAS